MWVAVIVLLVVVVLLLRDPDVGWHLALGREVAEQRRVPDREPFTHTARDRPMVAHEWLSQLAYYGAVRAWDVVGMRRAHAVFAAALFFVLLWIRLERSGRSAIIAFTSQPFAMQWPWPLCVLPMASSSVKLQQTPVAMASWPA